MRETDYVLGTMELNELFYMSVQMLTEVFCFNLSFLASCQNGGCRKRRKSHKIC